MTLPDTVAVLAQRGDQWATWQLLQLHERAIKLHAGKAMASAFSMTREDMLQEATIGALELLKSWKPASGCTYYTWLFTWLPHRLRRAKDASDYIVKVPAHAGVKDRRNGALNTPFSTSIYAPSKDIEDCEVLRAEVEASGAQIDYVQRDLMRWLARSIDQLPERERDAVRATYLDGASQADLAEAWGCTRQNVSQFARTGVARLKRMAKAAM